jgi:hypothetical protein
MSKRKLAYPSIDDVQRRVANISIGASTLRSQGVDPEEAKNFLRKLNLNELREMPKKRFEGWLNKKTKSLVKEFKRNRGDQDNWGAARKVINIFLENAFYNRFLYEEYSLQKLEDMLEVPLDKNVREELKKDWERYLKEHKMNPDLHKLPRCKSIKGLCKEDSDEFQTCAYKVAKGEPTYRYRIYLDLKYWRPSEVE